LKQALIFLPCHIEDEKRTIKVDIEGAQRVVDHSLNTGKKKK
jgi:N-methylhydantoinase B/oxoprolinase/acetone carboxylase alpha subunit